MERIRLRNVERAKAATVQQVKSLLGFVFCCWITFSQGNISLAKYLPELFIAIFR